jgi:hypothetical protein
MNENKDQFVPSIRGNLKKHIIHVPEVIKYASGILINGRLIKSLLFSTDVAIIKNMNADAIIAVYPFTPSPVITHSIILAADVPVFTGVGGGTTRGERVISLANHAEYQGSIGVVVNAPTDNSTIVQMSHIIDIPIVVTVVSHNVDINARLEAGAKIINVSAASQTASVVKQIRKDHPKVPIIATGGPNDETILQTIEAGANAITYTPPTNGELFSVLMDKYRIEEENR